MGRLLEREISNKGFSFKKNAVDGKVIAKGGSDNDLYKLYGSYQSRIRICWWSGRNYEMVLYILEDKSFYRHRVIFITLYL